MKKKILMVAYDFPPQWGGVSTYGWELAHAFSKKGFEVTVLTRQHLQSIDAPFGQKTVKLPSSGLLALPALLYHLVRILQKENYHHIFCNLWLPEGLSTYLALKLLNKKTPYSVSVHAMEIMDSTATLKKRARKSLSILKPFVFTRAKRIFCVSHFTADQLRKQISAKPLAIEVVANGANPETFSQNAEKSASPRLFTACRLMANKGVDQVIQALPAVLSQVPNIKYHISGEGPDRKRLEGLVEKLNLAEHVQFLGKLSLQDLKREYSEADLFVMLSRQEQHYVEGFGLVFLEAALCGTPSLGGRSGGIPDAIIEGQTGWLVDPHNQKDIIEKLIELLSDRKALKSKGLQARDYTITYRTWDHTANQLIGALENLS